MAQINEPTGGTLVKQDSYAGGIATQLADKKAQLLALQKNNLTYTSQLTKDTAGNYVPTTLSNQNKQEQVNSNINRLNEITTSRGITIDENGVQHYADGSIVPSSPYDQYTNYRNAGGTADMTTWENSGRPTGQSATEGTATGETPLATADTSSEDASTQALLDQMKATSDANTKMLIDNIQQKFEQRRMEQRDINQRQLAGTQNALLMGRALGMGSSAQYAPISSGGIITAQESYGVKQIADLDAEEMDLIAQAKAAQFTNDYKLMETKLNQLEETRKAKIDATNELNKKIIEQNQKIRETNLASQKDSAIADLYGQGITDVPTIMSELKKQGITMTSKEVADTIKNIVPSGLDDLIKTARTNGAPQDVISKILSSKTLDEAYQNAGNYALGGTGIIGEYNYAKANGYTGSFSDYQNEDANRKAKVAASAAGLSPTTLTKVLTVAGQFDGEQIVKDYNQIVQSLDAVKNAGTTPTDDIQRVYAFAKIMDPNSVVREGEYNTVQKYAQQWTAKFANEMRRVVQNKGFLSQEARDFMLKTLNNRFSSTEKAYKNLYDEYGRRIDKMTGQNDGTDYITDYSKPFDKTNNIILSDKEAIDKITNWVKQSSENQKKYNELKSMLPDATASEIAGQLGL